MLHRDNTQEEPVIMKVNNKHILLKQYSSSLDDCASREALNEETTIQGHQLKSVLTQIHTFWFPYSIFMPKVVTPLMHARCLMKCLSKMLSLGLH